MRCTIEQYSQKFKMSKEMIHSKLRAKKLNYIIEHGITYIILENMSDEKKTLEKELDTKTNTKPKTTVATVLALYQRENHQLKERIALLEIKIDNLIDDKEQMLRDEMQKIEQVYSDKDAQLKTILELVNTKLLMDNPQEIHEIQTIENNASINQEDESFELIELREYLKSLDIKSSQRKIIKKRFLSLHDTDIRIMQQNGKLYLDLSKYDYSDLLQI